MSLSSTTRNLLIIGGILVITAIIIYVSQKKEQAPAAGKVSAGMEGPVPNATLTIGDGSKILIDTSLDKVLTKEGGCEVAIRNGKLVYACDPDSSSGIKHKLAVAKGTRLSLILSDSTQITMNAASKLTYPVSFNKRNRQADLTGEAFFNIASDAEKPFVIIARQEYAGFATSGQFNINANFGSRGVIFSAIKDSIAALSGYEDKIPAAVLKRIYLDSDNQFITPGKNVQILSPTEVKSGTVDETQTLAWLNNRFGFDYFTLPEAMDEIIRWYDIEVEYIDEPPYFDYTETPSRSTPLPQLLKLLESARANFRVENDGKKVIVIGEKEKK